jgi:cold shock protein
MTSDRDIGTVKFYDAVKGFGFIAPDGPGPDVFVHARSLRMSEIDELQAGDRVEYRPVPDNRGVQAYEPQLLSRAEG